MTKKWYYILLVPGLVLLLVFLILPLVFTIGSTFFGDGSFTLEKYINFFMDEYYMEIFIRTLKIAVISSAICAVLGLPVAYFVSRANNNIRGLLLACSVFPLLTNSVVRSFAWMSILGKNGLFNSILMSLGFVSEPVKLLYTETAIIIGTVYLFLPLMIVSLVGVMESIENDLLEAAASLGANRMTSFFKVIFPLSLPGLIVGTVLVFTGALTAYSTPQLLGGNSNMVLATLVYQKAMSLGDFTGAAVVATIMIITTVIVINVLNSLAAKLDKRGV